MRIPHDIGDADTFHAVDGLEVDIAHLIPVRLLETLHEERPIGVAYEERADGALVVYEHVNCERVGRRLDNRICVLAEPSRRRVWETRFRPCFSVHGHIQQHVAGRALGEILERHDCELGHDGERDHTASVLPDPEVLDLLLGLEEVSR